MIDESRVLGLECSGWVKNNELDDDYNE